VLSTQVVEVMDEKEVDPFASAPRPLVGSYEIVVRGPLGRGLSREVVIVEGMMLKTDPPWREFVAGGLAPCVADVAAAAEVAFTTRHAALRSDQSGFSDRGVGKRL
jgi:hypothetical protein